MNGGARNSSSNVMSAASPGIRHRTIRPSRRASARLDLAARRPQALGRRVALAAVGDAHRWLRQPVVEVGHALGQHVTSDDAAAGAVRSRGRLGRNWVYRGETSRAVRLGRDQRTSPLDGDPGAPATTENPIIIPSRDPTPDRPARPAGRGRAWHPADGCRAPGVAITFDDGPHPEGTPAVLEILAEADIKATFFLVGEQVERRPALAAEIAGQGHLIALHGYRHRPQPAMSQKAVQRRRGNGARRRSRARRRTALAWHRPPYGVYSPAGLAAARARGLRPLLWSRWGKDWRRFTTPARIAARATANVRPGDVILLHDADFYSSKGSHERTVQALELIVRELKRQKIGTVLPV